MRKTGMLFLVLLVSFTLAAFPAFGATQETMKAAAVKAEVKADEQGNVKLLLGRGQNLSLIARRYTGSAKNWVAIAKASGLKTDNKSQRKLSIGTVLVVPQELLKQNLKPIPSVEPFRVLQGAVDIAEKELTKFHKELTSANQWLQYWKAIVLGLIAALFMVLYAAVSIYRKNQKISADYEQSQDELASYKEKASMLPGSHMRFEFREGQVVEALITRVDYEWDDHGGKPFISEVGCLVCTLRLNPENFKSHYSQQHSDKLNDRIETRGEGDASNQAAVAV